MWFYDNIIFENEKALNYYFYELVDDSEIKDYCECEGISPTEYDELTDEEKDDIRWEIAFINKNYSFNEIAEFELKFNKDGRCDLLFGM